MARRKVLTAEEKEKIQKDGSLDDVLRMHIPEPTYIFNVGDRVIYGAWDKAEIEEVCENGKYYLVRQETKNISYGQYLGQTVEHRYHAWVALKPYINLCPKRVIENNDIRFNYSQRDISSLLHMAYSGSAGIDLNPDYQRGNVWSLYQKVSLIDSIFKNIDIGKFTIIRRPFTEDAEHYYEMLDGKQRLTAILDFFEGRFKYRGMFFHEMHGRDQNHFEGYAVSYAETEPLTDEQKYRYFLKLNTTGMPISEGHIQHVQELWLKAKEKNV